MQSEADLYVVLVDTKTDWPDCVFVGSWEDASQFDKSISHDYHTSVQAVVTMNDVD